MLSVIKRIGGSILPKHQEYEINLNGEVFVGQENKTILASALSNGIDINYSCGSGVCRQCKIYVEHGLVKNIADDKTCVLSCRAYPKSNLKLVQV